MGLKWSSLRRNKDIVPETTVPPPSTAHVPSNQARAHSVVEGILPGMNDAEEDAADSSRPASHSPKAMDSRAFISTGTESMP